MMADSVGPVKAIFCPEGHLMLEAQSCPKCGWERPRRATVGKPAWGPIAANGGFGRAGMRSFLGWALLDQVLVLPRQNSGWLVFSKRTGEVLWEAAMEPGQVIYDLAPLGDKLLASVNDERDLLHADTARLVLIDPQAETVEEIWQAKRSTLTAPVVHKNRIMLRDAVKGLVVLDTEPPYRELYSIEMAHYAFEKPIVVGNLVMLCDGSAMHNEIHLKAFDLMGGKFVWESPPVRAMLSDVLVLDSQRLVFTPNRRELKMLDVQHPSAFVWEVALGKIYTAPITLGDEIGVVNRGSKDPKAEDHYLFTRINPESGEALSSVPIGIRGDQIIAVNPDRVILSAHDINYRAILRCINPKTGRLIWDYTFETEADPIQAVLKMDETCLYTATAGGKVIALQVAEADQAPVHSTPEALLEKGKPEEAASLLALSGDLVGASEIFEEHLKQPEKALQLLLAVDSFKLAGDLAQRQGWHHRALTFFNRADDQESQAEVLEAMGDRIEAARRYEALGKHQKAGLLYEKVGDVVKAFRNYATAGDSEGMRRLTDQMQTLPEDIGLNLRDIENCLSQGLHEEAARLATRLGQLERAAKIYQEVGAQSEELKVLQRLALKEYAGEWTFERLSELGKELGRFDIVGAACEQLEAFHAAAEAYERAAEDIIDSVKDENEAAGFYEKARLCYQECGQINELPRIQRRIIHLKHLPNIAVQIVRLARPLREEDHNFLTLQIDNDGFGVAHDIELMIRSPYFEFHSQHLPIKINHLGPNLTVTKQVYLKPHEHGHVPLDFEWHWWNRSGQHFSNTMTGQIAVQSLEDSRSGQPNVVYATNWIASGDVHNVNGDLIQDGGQKGDKVEVGDGRVRMQADDLGEVAVGEDAQPTRKCPACGRKIDLDSNVCTYCGVQLNQ